MEKYALYMRTVRYLKPRQVYFRLRNTVRRRLRASAGRSYSLSVQRMGRPLGLEATIPRANSCVGRTFKFLNLAKTFTEIDWNFAGYGKLWRYNLNYFDYLNQEGMPTEEGLRLIREFISSLRDGDEGLEPFPVSLRAVNWIKFLSRNMVSDPAIDYSLYAQVLILKDNLEYHLLGNHLFENACALLFAGYYFSDGGLKAQGRGILMRELDEQVLPDGGHFELSPMYHLLILEKALDCLNLVKSNRATGDDGLLMLLAEKAAVMLGWLEQVVFDNGDIPLVNDAAFGIAPTPAAVADYASRLGVLARPVRLRESGYRMIRRGEYQLFADVGNIGPDYIPGHAHSDTFNFLLHVRGKPLIVDTGTSTYEPDLTRALQRGTRAHNTVEVGGREQSEVWSSFRVGRRAYVIDLKEDQGSIEAEHDGYAITGASHRRRFAFSDKEIMISDDVRSSGKPQCLAVLHFHPEAGVSVDCDTVSAGGAEIRFEGASTIEAADYLYAPEFNTLIPARSVIARFTGSLKTIIRV